MYMMPPSRRYDSSIQIDPVATSCHVMCLEAGMMLLVLSQQHHAAFGCLKVAREAIASFCQLAE